MLIRATRVLTWNDMRLGRATNVPNNQTITIIILARNLDELAFKGQIMPR